MTPAVQPCRPVPAYWTFWFSRAATAVLKVLQTWRGSCSVLLDSLNLQHFVVANYKFTPTMYIQVIDSRFKQSESMFICLFLKPIQWTVILISMWINSSFKQAEGRTQKSSAICNLAVLWAWLECFPNTWVDVIHIWSTLTTHGNNFVTCISKKNKRSVIYPSKEPANLCMNPWSKIYHNPYSA
jgi:hypothetical protein